MTHLAHTGPEGTLWHDDCPECEERAAALPGSLGTLDDRRRIIAWRNMRAVRWSGGHPSHTVTHAVSACDRQLYDALYVVGVFMERMGIGPDEIEDRSIAHVVEINAQLAAAGSTISVDVSGLF